MAGKKTFAYFVLKSCLLVALIYLPLYFVGQLSLFSAAEDPRKYLFAQDDFSPYRYAIIGDSVFCSYYVDDIDQTMWKRFEALTGEQCFPAALNGATIADMVSASEYLSRVLPDGSTVFVGLIPTRFVGKGIVRHQNYFNDFFLLSDQGQVSPVAMLFKEVADRMLRGLLFYREPFAFENRLRRKRTQVYDQGAYSWQDKREVAKKRFRAFVASSHQLESHIDTVALQQIRDNLSARGMRAVFVLSPLNNGLIEAFSSPEEAASVRIKLDSAYTELKKHLNQSGALYIDAYDKVETDCFIDLVHVNACGDEVLARAYAEFAAVKN